MDIGVTKQDPSARLGQKDPSNGTKKRMFALFQVEGKGTAQKIETDLQVYVKRLKYEGFTNKLTAAGNGVHEAMNTAQNTLGASGAKPTRACVPRTVNDATTSFNQPLHAPWYDG